MNDAKNLSKLLGHLPTAVFRDFMQYEFALRLPASDAKQSKRTQRAAMEDCLSALDVSQRQQIDEIAERLVMLSDGAGQDVIEGLIPTLFDPIGRQTFDNLHNQYERALWLYIHEPEVFRDALDARQADVFRQSASCYSGFIAPKQLTVLTDTNAQQGFNEQVAGQLGCAEDAVAIQIFKRLRPDFKTGEDVDLIQISIHHNRPPEIIDCVQDRELVPQEVVRAVSSHVTYEPANGNLEVLSKYTEWREPLARIVADVLLRSPFSGERIPLKKYEYQSLATPRTFDLAGEEAVAWAKVTEIGYSDSNRTLLFKIWANDADDIHGAAQSTIDPTFDFSPHPINYAKLGIRLKKVGKERPRTLYVILREENKCNIKAKREKDRAICDRLLVKWQLVRIVGHAA